MSIPILTNWINNISVVVQNTSLKSSPGCIQVENPATGQVIAECPISNQNDVNLAVESASLAFDQWR